jgi:pyruvate/2-oxoglutarate dehydrogenase complex dihydrolipoamide acyltransferase (E2) component
MDIIMPKMGESVNEGTIIKWHKKVGDVVKLDEIIFEISTDKVDTEIPAASAGVLSEILVKEGDTVEVGTVVARIQASSESNVEVAPAKVEAEQVVEEKVISEVETPKVSEPVQSKSSNGNVIEIAMPKMGESVMEGTIIKWNKKVGDAS